MPRFLHLALIVLLLGPSVSSQAQVSAPPQYKVSILKQYDRNGPYISIGGINNRGDYVYNSTSDSGIGSYGYLKYANGGVASLWLWGARESALYDFNDRGDVVGWSFGTPPDQVRYPVVNINGVLTRLDANGSPILSANGINNRQQVVGSMITPDGTRRGYIYDGISYQQLGTLGGANSDASEINDLGQVLGSAETADGAAHPYLYENGTMTDLTTLDGWRGWPTGINDVGQIIGSYRDVSGDHAFFYADGQLSVIGQPGEASEAHGINDLGQVVGFLGTGWIRTPFLWQDGQLYDLRTLFASADDYYYIDVGGINDLGQITLHGCGAGPWPANQTCSLLLLSPIPELSEAAMLLAGLLIIACSRSRWRRPQGSGRTPAQNGDVQI